MHLNQKWEKSFKWWYYHKSLRLDLIISLLSANCHETSRKLPFIPFLSTKLSLSKYYFYRSHKKNFQTPQFWQLQYARQCAQVHCRTWRRPRWKLYSSLLVDPEIVKTIHIPNDGGLDAKWIEPNTEDSEKASSIIRPSGSHIAPWNHDIV